MVHLDSAVVSFHKTVVVANSSWRSCPTNNIGAIFGGVPCGDGGVARYLEELKFENLTFWISVFSPCSHNSKILL